MPISPTWLEGADKLGHRKPSHALSGLDPTPRVIRRDLALPPGAVQRGLEDRQHAICARTTAPPPLPVFTVSVDFAVSLFGPGARPKSGSLVRHILEPAAQLRCGQLGARDITEGRQDQRFGAPARILARFAVRLEENEVIIEAARMV